MRRKLAPVGVRTGPTPNTGTPRPRPRPQAEGGPGGRQEQFEAFETAPPAALDWERLSRTERLFVGERVARTDRTVEEFDGST